MGDASVGGELRDALAAFDQDFAAGRLDDFSAHFSEDARLLIHEQPTVSGKAGIVASFAQVFDLFDTSSYTPSYEVVDVADDRAYVLSSFEEVLRPRDGQAGVRIHGRIVQFWRREDDGRWRLVVLLTSRSSPDELVDET